MAHARQRARRGDSMTTRRPQTHPDMRRRMPQPNGPYCSLRRSTSFGRSPRLVPRSGRSSRAAEGVEAVGRGQPFATCTARRRRPFTAPKVDMLGSPILAHISFDAAARERLAQWRHCPARPLYLKLVGIKIASVFDKIEISKQLSSPPRSQAPRC